MAAMFVEAERARGAFATRMRWNRLGMGASGVGLTDDVHDAGVVVRAASGARAGSRSRRRRWFITPVTHSLTGAIRLRQRLHSTVQMFPHGTYLRNAPVDCGSSH
jgi:hypothetical protein